MDYHKKHEKYKRKRRISRSTSPAERRSRPSKTITDYKYELGRFLTEQANIDSTHDFWNFFEKYKTLQTLQKSDTDKTKLINFVFIEKESILYDRLPVLDKKGNRVEISKEDFKDFLLVIKVYLDFQQKSSFSKIRKLKIFQNDLPIAKYKSEIIEKLKGSRVLLIAGDTGCGKSTQVPQYVMEAGFNKIVCTQPRRIACVSLAKRVAHETLSEYKNTVGYQIRFEKTKRSDTKIIFMTEGLLLRQASEKETIESYDVIILDEVHERNLHGDFLIGIMKCLLHQRDNFKLILMSATINIELFSNYFAEENIQVIQVPGRLYPIEIQYRPITKDPFERKRDKLDCTPYLQILQMIDEKYLLSQKGDMLIFLNGFSEISTLADAITEYSQHKKNWLVLPLHSTLSLEEQDKVFDYPPEGVRKCIISTNIAETSVTIDGIRFVVDSGKVNRMSYNTQLGVNKLSEFNISQDSAKQRAGRAGRTGPGTCFRLYSEDDLKDFEPFTPAEIHQVPLDSLLLHMISLGLSNIANFPFIEKPAAKSLEESMEKLKFIGALALDNEYFTLTQLGDSLSQLPVNLTIGKMLIMSTVFGNVNSVLALASLLSVQNPLTQQSQRNLEARDLRKPMESSHGDPVTLLNFFKEWLTVKQTSTPAKGRSKREEGYNSKIWAKKRCIEEQRFYEATKLIEQFRDILQEADLLPKITEDNLSSGERSIRLGELKQLKSMRYRLKNEEKMKSRKQLKYEMYNTGDTDQDSEKVDIRDVEFRISHDFKRLQKLLNEASADSYKDLMMLKLILTSGLYPQIAVEDEFNASKTVVERLYHTKQNNYVFLRPDCYFASNPDVLELHNDDIEVPPAGYFSKRPISRKHQVLVYQSILETKKVYLVNTMRMPALQTLLILGKTVATNDTFSKFVVDDFLLFDVPYFGQGKTILMKAITLRKKWKSKLESKLKDPTNTKINQKDIFYFTEELINYMATEVCYNIKRLLPADLKDTYNRDTEIFENENIEGNENPFSEDFQITKNYKLGGINITENVVFGCLFQEQWESELEQKISNTPFICRHCNESRFGSTFFGNLRHETFCKSKVIEQINDSNEDVNIAKPNSKKYYCPVCKKDLLLTPESAAIQMLIETCSATKSDNEIPGRQWALQEVRSLVCSYLHQAFIADTMLCKLVHFQTYPSELIEIVVKGVPSMHICLDFLQELMQQPSLNKQIFGIQLLSHISLQYALPKSMNLCVLALNLLFALLGGLSSAQRVKLYKPVLPALVRISEAFPPLTEDIINLLMQLARVCESQASLASHFDVHLGKSLEIASQESAELCDLTQRTFSDILDKAVLKAKIYKQD